jgi:hypothetical protein
MTNEEFIKSISIEGEEWRDVVGYEGLYMVSSLGRIASIERTIIQKNGIQRVLKQTILKNKVSKGGYEAVFLHNTHTRKRLSIHRLVAIAFIPNLENKPCVDHIDRNRSNNVVSNLRWCTYSENMKNPLSLPYYRAINLGRKRPYAYHPVVALKDGAVIYKFDKLTDCIQFGFDYTSVSSICVGRRKKHKGFSFMYLSDYEALTNKSKNAIPNPD